MFKAGELLGVNVDHNFYLVIYGYFYWGLPVL